MRAKLFSVFAAVLALALTGMTGYFLPEAVLRVSDRELEGARETVDVEKISLSYETRPDICRKLWLVSNAVEVSSFYPEKTTLSEGEAAGAVLDFVSGFMGEVKHMINIYAEPRLVLYANGESIVLWEVAFNTEEYFQGFFTVDDESGSILGFELLPNMFIAAEEPVLERENLWDVEAVASALIGNYGIPGAYYAENRLCIPCGEGEILEAELYDVPIEGVLVFNR
ncbi:MAG: hypothetical protein IJY86_07150 [Clostridia bacterium]|nr:hypothetical protein [Clostridia bacterium]